MTLLGKKKSKPHGYPFLLFLLKGFLKVLTGPFTTVIWSLAPLMVVAIEWECRVSRWLNLMAGIGNSIYMRHPAPVKDNSTS
jgi:hypothetical protein